MFTKVYLPIIMVVLAKDILITSVQLRSCRYVSGGLMKAFGHDADLFYCKHVTSFITWDMIYMFSLFIRSVVPQ